MEILRRKQRDCDTGSGQGPLKANATEHERE